MNADQKKLRDAVTSLYIETGEDHTSDEVAVRLGWRAERIYVIAHDDGGLIIDGVQEYMNHRARWVYGPTREHLRVVVASHIDRLSRAYEAIHGSRQS